jgi:hypothetical protein
LEDTKFYSNIITPPDFPSDPYHSVLLIDPEWREIEDIAFFLKTATVSFNVFIYRTEMNDNKWFAEATDKVDAIVVNTVVNDISPLKDLIATRSKSHYYGPKNFLINNNRLSKPIDYFVLHSQEI